MPPSAYLQPNTNDPGGEHRLCVLIGGHHGFELRLAEIWMRFAEAGPFDRRVSILPARGEFPPSSCNRPSVPENMAVLTRFLTEVSNMADSQPHAHTRWYHGLTGYHWWVLAIAVCAWMFDCMDQRLFVLSRAPAVKQLLNEEQYKQKILPDIQAKATEEIDAEVAASKLAESGRQEALETRVEAKLESAFASRAADFGNIVTALMVIGWSVGGFGFGIYGDRLGRVRTLAIAIFVYSIFTGLSGFSVGLIDFCVYRFLMGCGIGGAFATAATLIAETMPDHARATALGLFQSLSALGNIGGSCIAWFVVSPDLDTNLFGLLNTAVAGWRILFMIGVLPALLIVLIMRTVREPDAWYAAKKTASDNLERQMGDIRSLFSDPRWRRNTIGRTVAGRRRRHRPVGSRFLFTRID